MSEASTSWCALELSMESADLSKNIKMLHESEYPKKKIKLTSMVLSLIQTYDPKKKKSQVIKDAVKYSSRKVSIWILKAFPIIILLILSSRTKIIPWEFFI